jgi:hypothetical protein
MAIALFPALAPSARGWQPGSPPVGVFTSMSGYETRMQYGSAAIGATLSLTWTTLTEAQIWQIIDHHQSAAGVEAFQLPAAVFAGMSRYPWGATWRYSSPPSVTWLAPGLGSVQLDLVQVLA